MDSFINHEIYKKESVEISGDFFTGLYFKDAKGRDWYETLKDWVGAISLDSAGIVCAFETDVSYIGMKEGRSVYEVDPASVPESVLGNFTYKDGVFTDIRPGVVELANMRKAELIQEAANTISPLQDAVDLDIATDDETTQLLAWKKYRVLLNRVDTSTAPNIKWPELESS